jgi:DNA-binding transcriptional LysR family regulator
MRGFAWFNLRHLEGVAEIRRTGSFGAAAGAISLTQSALTQAVASLERRVERSLFERQPRGATPTTAGHLLADSVDRALAILNAADPSHRTPLVRRVTGTQLLALAAVESASAFRGGARASGLSEASIHRAVRDLERSLGAALIVRTGTGIAPTPAATALAHAARQAMAEIELGFEAARNGGRAVVVGAMPLVRAGLLPSAMAQLCAREPHARVRVMEGAYAELLAALLDGKIDMLLGALREAAPDGAVQRQLFNDDMVVVARSDHPLARNSDWQASALADFPWAASPPGTPRRARWEDMLRAGGIEPPAPQVECSSASAARGLLLQGNWLAMLSPDQFRIERELGLLIPLGGPLPISTRPIGITLRAGWRPDRTQALMIDILQSCADEHGYPATPLGVAGQAAAD